MCYNPCPGKNRRLFQGNGTIMGKKVLPVFMAALRIAIGWHFLYEGVWKLMQKDGWSCLSYLDSAQGPLAWLFKWMASQGWIVAIGDRAVEFGLVAIGLALITGVLARIAALFGIALMAMFYCCQPPEPFATAMSGADGCARSCPARSLWPSSADVPGCTTAQAASTRLRPSPPPPCRRGRCRETSRYLCTIRREYSNYV